MDWDDLFKRGLVVQNQVDDLAVMLDERGDLLIVERATGTDGFDTVIVVSPGNVRGLVAKICELTDSDQPVSDAERARRYRQRKKEASQNVTERHEARDARHEERDETLRVVGTGEAS